MLRSKMVPAAMAAVIALGAASGIAHASDNGRSGENDRAQERAAILGAKTSIAQAIAAAEQETGGKAIDAGLENQNGNMSYEVEIAKGDKVEKVLVDLQTGKVLKVAAADTEHGEDEDQD